MAVCSGLSFAKTLTYASLSFALCSASGCSAAGQSEPNGQRAEQPTAGNPSEPPPPPQHVDAAIVACQTDARFVAGAGIADITGPVTDISTGYNSPGEMMEGLGLRLYSRAFVIESPCSRQRIAFVSADVLHLYQSLKLGVAKRLALRLPGLYDETNVMLTGTHTHAAPTNISWRTLYNLFNGVAGFDELNYNVIVDGIVESIVRAHNNRIPARISIARGTVPGAAHNRSALAYAANPDAAEYASDVDESMVLLKLSGEDGSEIGLINWFAVHGTSLSQNIHLVHGDNKGWAAWRFDRGGRVGNPPFVAAFAQGAMGDVSPNQPDPADPTAPFLRPSDLDPSLEPYDDARIHGDMQYQAAQKLYAAATEPVTGGVYFGHRYVDFQNIAVDPIYGAPANARTCIAAIGAGFAAGTEEGSPSMLGGYREGELVYGGQAAAPTVSPEVQACQAEKPVVLQVGDVSAWWVNDVPWVTTDVPLQIFLVGNVALVGSSFELTTMAGRRLRRLLGSTLGPLAITDVVPATIANAYNHYLTTREEYALQHFEGAFTHFGPWSEAAFRQECDRLARALVTGEWIASGPAPMDLSDQQVVRTPIASEGVVNDAPGGAAFGEVVSDVSERYSRPNDIVSVTFWSAHPRTVLSLQQAGTLSPYYPAGSFTFLEVQRQTASGWQTVATDADPETRFHWARIGGSLAPFSQVTVSYKLTYAESGTYRIVHHGLAKQSLLGLAPTYVPFSGTSSSFEVQ